MTKNWYVLLDGNNKRIKVDGKIVKPFEYAKQAEKFIDNRLGGSPYVKILRTDIISKNLIGGMPRDPVKQYGNQQLAQWQNNLRNKRLM